MKPEAGITDTKIDRYFERSERMNVLQRRIKDFVVLLQTAYLGLVQQEAKGRSMPHQQLEFYHGLSTTVARDIPKRNITLVLEISHTLKERAGGWRIDQKCNFRLIDPKSQLVYLLGTNDLPDKLIGLVYSNLTLLITLMQEAKNPYAKTAAKNVQEGMLRYLE